MADPHKLTDLELRRIQAEGFFDGRGRLLNLHGVTIDWCADGQALWIGADLPDALADQLAAAFAGAPGAPGAPDPIRPPPALEACRRLLETSGGPPLPCQASPSYLIQEGTRFDSAIEIVRSDGTPVAALRAANPGNWHPIEWEELLDGRLGPWAMARADGGAVVSICHTPGSLRARAAECGVWTDPAHRGRGYAAAVTSAWAEILRPSGRHLFYSTGAQNLSSQRVAQRLGLHPLGWTWRLGRYRDTGDAGDSNLHPLCSLRRRA
jgi:GNAT superfamily N-acetyltransferase